MQTRVNNRESKQEIFFKIYLHQGRRSSQGTIAESDNKTHIAAVPSERYPPTIPCSYTETIQSGSRTMLPSTSKSNVRSGKSALRVCCRDGISGCTARGICALQVEDGDHWTMVAVFDWALLIVVSASWDQLVR